jgi:hypothetical protein
MAQDEEFFREVDEEYRRDRIAQIWKAYNGVIVGAAILIVAAVGGWRFYEHRQDQSAQAAATQYQDAVQLAADGKDEEAGKALAALSKEAPGGYQLLTRFRLAAELGKGSAEEGAKAFDALAADTAIDPLWRDLAKLRAAMLRMDGPDQAQVRQALEPLAAAGQPWRHTAREMLGLSGLKSGDMDYAGRWFDQIAADRETPASLRQRLENYSALVAGGPAQATQ